jgi:hypothetical protein
MSPGASTKSSAATEQHRHQRDLQFVHHARTQVLLDHVRDAGDADVAPGRRFARQCRVRSGPSSLKSFESPSPIE